MQMKYLSRGVPFIFECLQRFCYYTHINSYFNIATGVRVVNTRTYTHFISLISLHSLLLSPFAPSSMFLANGNCELQLCLIKIFNFICLLQKYLHNLLVLDSLGQILQTPLNKRIIDFELKVIPTFNALLDLN